MKLTLDKPVSLAAPVSLVEVGAAHVDFRAGALRVTLGAPGSVPSRIVTVDVPPALLAGLAALVKGAVGAELGAVATEAAEVKP